MNVDPGSYGRSSSSSETSPGDDQDMNNDDMESPEDPSDPGDDLAGDDRSLDEETDTDKAELDEVEPEDLMCILQEWFGDEWQQQLHNLCHINTRIMPGDNELTDEDLDNISAFTLHLEGSGLPWSTFNCMHCFSITSSPLTWNTSSKGIYIFCLGLHLSSMICA
ncbi:hypothetical protein K439DRAFT_1617331 [Ramaria rubella]|nr:hypothetical protein K439DRAFT_1617331 [Ramaria rubella]